jgi:hypothetical protein
MYHNHIDKDYSFPWYTPDRYDRDDEWMARWMDGNTLLKFLFPFYGWPIYLYGLPDGSHFIPFAEQRIWKDTDKKEAVKCLISTASVIAAAASAFYYCECSIAKMAFYYLLVVDYCDLPTAPQPEHARVR